MPNQNPEQKARDQIDAQIRASGWVIQNANAIDFNEGQGQAVREYITDCGPADYVFFVDRRPVGVNEAKKETLGQNITTVETQTENYAAAKLKWVQHTGQPLPFLYESTGILTRFTDQRDPKPRSREVFTFHRPETLRAMLAKEKSLRSRLQDLPVLDPIDLRDCQVASIAGLDWSVKKAKPRSLVQMATGSGKTFALIRRACGIDEKLTPFDATVRRNFQTWIMGKHAGIPTEQKFTEAQTAWLQLIRDHLMTSLRFERDDLDFAPFDAQGGLGKMHQLFGDQMDGLIEELNGELVA